VRVNALSWRKPWFPRGTRRSTWCFSTTYSAWLWTIIWWITSQRVIYPSIGSANDGDNISHSEPVCVGIKFCHSDQVGVDPLQKSYTRSPTVGRWGTTLGTTETTLAQSSATSSFSWHASQKSYATSSAWSTVVGRPIWPRSIWISLVVSDATSFSTLFDVQDSTK